jgi:hypothetical protein
MHDHLAHRNPAEEVMLYKDWLALQTRNAERLWVYPLCYPRERHKAPAIVPGFVVSFRRVAQLDLLRRRFRRLLVTPSYGPAESSEVLMRCRVPRPNVPAAFPACDQEPSNTIGSLNRLVGSGL